MTQLQLRSEPAEWCEEVEQMLIKAVGNATIDDLKMQYDFGAQLFKLFANDDFIGYYILRVDHLANWSEGVFVAGVGSHPEINVTEAGLLMAEQQLKGCKFLRFHTSRAGLVKKALKIGFQPQEFILSKALN